MKILYLAGGCFWGVQKYLDQFRGVESTQVGYANGTTDRPTYEEVCGGSGHAETVKVTYDETVLSTQELLRRYFDVIDPLSVNRQGHDKGFQYRTGIYWTDETLAPEAQAAAEKVSARMGKPLAVELKPLESFWPAEEYHQKYLDKNPGGYCHIPGSMLRLKDV